MGIVASAGKGVDVVDALGVAVVLLLTFTLIFAEALPRTTSLLLGAALAVVWGTARGFFPADAAIASVSLQTLVILVTMTVISNVLAAAGLFTYLGIRIARAAGGNLLRLLVALSMFTYTFSLVADNLTVMITMGGLTVWLAAELRFDARPFVATVLIASNTGGASTAIGDFPNLIISERGGIGFLDFLSPLGMFWIGLLIQLCVLTFLCWLFRSQLRSPDDLGSRLASRLPVTMVARRLPSAIRSRRALFAGTAALVVALALFSTSQLHGWSPTEIALLASIVALVGSGLEHERLIDEVGLRYVMSFLGLFVLAGAADATGLIRALGDRLVDVSGGQPMFVALLILVPVAVVTAVVDAGPATAAFIPLIQALEHDLNAPGHLLWWALSLGVLAGSSATILGATAGTIAAGQVDAWFESRHGMEGGAGARRGFVAAFSRAGLPSAAIMLALGAGFLVVAFAWFSRGG